MPLLVVTPSGLLVNMLMKTIWQLHDAITQSQNDEMMILPNCGTKGKSRTGDGNDDLSDKNYLKLWWPVGPA